MLQNFTKSQNRHLISLGNLTYISAVNAADNMFWNHKKKRKFHRIMGLQNFMRSYCRWSFVKPALRSIVRYWCPGYLGQNATYILVVFFMSDDWLEGVSTLRIVQSQELKHVCYSSVCASWATALKPEWNSLPLGCGYIWNLWFVNVKIFFHLNKGDRVFLHLITD